jgi:SAM-dependent methyltransferase
MDLQEGKGRLFQEVHRHPWELVRLEVLWALLRAHFPDLEKRSLCFLDVGCGDGCVLKFLSSRLPQSQFLGVDKALTPQMLQVLQARFAGRRARFFNSFQEAVQESDIRIDGVFLLDVVEHTEDDVSFLKEFVANSRIVQGAVFLITVPAFQSLYTAHDDFLKHYRRYSRRTIERCALAAGLKVQESGYFFFCLLFPRWLEKLKEKVWGRPQRQDSSLGEYRSQRVKDSVFQNVLIADFRISLILRKWGIIVPGLSGYLVCQKSVS